MSVEVVKVKAEGGLADGSERTARLVTQWIPPPCY